jgi:Potential Queuosine, Q, salvage protein family
MQTPREVADAIGIDLSPSSTVLINKSRLLQVADLLSSTEGFVTPAKWDDPTFWNIEASVPERSQYFTIGNSINFRFWSLDGDRLIGAAGPIDGQVFRGSLYMWRCLRRCVDQQTYPLLNSEFLAQITESQFDRIFADDLGRNPLLIGRQDRILNLRDLGQRLTDDWNGVFYNVLEASEGSLVRFARFSAAFRAFDDPLHKLTMVNAILHSGSNVFTFRDEVLPGIDYELLKQLLRQGIIRPPRDVEIKLMSFELLSAAEAFEMRRMALAALVEVSELTGIIGEVLDNRYWWNRLRCTESAPVCERPDEAASCPFWGACEQLVRLHRPLELTRYY